MRILRKVKKMVLRIEQVDLLLAKRKMQRQDLAKLYGCTRQRMYRILNTKEVTATTAGKLAEVLEVPVEWIVEV